MQRVLQVLAANDGAVIVGADRQDRSNAGHFHVINLDPYSRGVADVSAAAKYVLQVQSLLFGLKNVVLCVAIFATEFGLIIFDFS